MKTKREPVTIFGVYVETHRRTVRARIEHTQAVPHGTGWRTTGERLLSFGCSLLPSASVASTSRAGAIDNAESKVLCDIAGLEKRIAGEREKLNAIRELRSEDK